MKTVLLVLPFAFLFGPLGSAADISSLMKQIVDLRADLEILSQDVDQNSKEKQAQVDLWLQKKSELQASLQKEQLRSLQIAEKIKALASRIKIQDQKDPKSQEQLAKWIGNAETWVRTSLPYRRESRITTLLDLKKRSQRGLESQESLAAELWQFYENELKMSGDNEFRIVEIQTSSGPQKAEVARLGLYTMYAALPNGQVKQSVLNGGTWTLQDLEGEDLQSAVRLLNNLKAKKESGLYRMPRNQGTEKL